MIGYIKGNLLNADNGTVILENNGIGYEITCSNTAYNRLIGNNGGEVYTYLAVREDGVYLYGFDNIKEKNMFLKLITVSGVGPKMAITVLSGMSLNDLAIRIATSDVKGLSTIKGLGKKTAERIILELREKITADGKEEINETKKEEVAVNEDAVIALMSLGLSRSESVNLVKTAVNEGLNSVQEIVTYSLKNIR